MHKRHQRSLNDEERDFLKMLFWKDYAPQLENGAFMAVHGGFLLNKEYIKYLRKIRKPSLFRKDHLVRGLIDSKDISIIFRYSSYFLFSAFVLMASLFGKSANFYILIYFLPLPIAWAYIRDWEDVVDKGLKEEIFYIFDGELRAIQETLN